MHARCVRWFLPLALAALASFAVRADEFDALRLRWRDLLTGGTNLNLADPAVQSRLASIASSANSYWSSMDKSAARTYLWSDAGGTNSSPHISTCYSRLLAMALAWATRGCSLEGNAALAADTVGGLDWMYANRYNETKSEYGNWWDWEIGAPQRLNDAAVLMYPALTGTQVTNYNKAVDKFSPVASMTGANLTDKCLVVALRGILGRNAAKLTNASTGLSPVFLYVTSGDGFYRDGSFIQHTKHPYTGSYGAVVIDGLSRILVLLSGSTWQVTDPAQTNLYRWLYDSYEPVLCHGALMDHIRGRAISRSGSQDHSAGAGVINTILRVAQFAPPADAAAFQSMVKHWIATDTFRNFTNNVPLHSLRWTQDLMADAHIAPRGELVRHCQFPSMDRVVHFRPGFAFALSLSSTRIYTYESINGENRRAWFTGDGMTYLYNDDLGQFSSDFWPTVDPYHLPGTTVDTTPRALGSGQSTASSQNWVGGATLAGLYGAAGMSLDAYSSSLLAKKSWFLFDNEIVCLGAGISCTGTSAVHTTIENRRLPDSATNTFTVNGAVMPVTVGWSSNLTSASWCALGGVGGYYFPGGATVRAVREARTNSWFEINTNGSTSLITRRYLKLWFDHGTNPVNATYGYVLLPNLGPSSVASYAAAPEVTVLTNSPTVQAVREQTLGITAANFWVDTTHSVGGLTVDRKASVLLRTTTTNLQLAVSDPTQAGTNQVIVQLDRPALAVNSLSAGVTVLQLAPVVRVSVAVSGARGQTFTADLSTVPLPNQPPVANGDTATTEPGTPALISPLANDTDPDAGPAPLSLVAVSTPAHGSATMVSNQVRYVPSPGFSGNDAFNYVTSDGESSATGAVNVAVSLGPLRPLSLTASGWQEPNVPENTLDGDLATRWSCDGNGQWIAYDLGSSHRLDAVSVAFYSGDTRRAFFEVQVSPDGVNWTQVSTNVSSGTTTNLQRFDPTDTWTRWVRLVGHGNSASTWNRFRKR